MARRRIMLVVITALLSAAVAQAVLPAKKELVFWFTWTDEGETAIRELVRLFHETQKEFAIRPVLCTDSEMNQRLLTAVAGKVPPDLVLLDRYRTAQFASRGALTDLGGYVGKSGVVRKEGFFRACWNECIYGGNIYAIPFETDNRLLMYNKRLFKEAGLDPDSPPKTWDELFRCAQRLTRTDKDGRITCLGFNPTGHGVSLVHYIWQNGGDVFNKDMTKVIFHHEEGIEALEWVCKLIDWYGYERMNSFVASFGSNAADPFYIGMEAMKSDGSWIYADIKRYAPDFFRNDLGLAPLPYSTSRATLAGGFALVMPLGAKNQDLAWRFIEFASSKQAQILFATRAGAIPALRAAAESGDFRGSSPFWPPFIEEMEYARFRPVHPAFPEIEDYIYTAVDEATRGVKTPERALADAAASAQKILDRYNRHLKK